MSFGGKQYEHRFFNAPKVHLQHINGSAGPDIIQSRYQSAMGPPSHRPFHFQ